MVVVGEFSQKSIEGFFKKTCLLNFCWENCQKSIKVTLDGQQTIETF